MKKQSGVIWITGYSSAGKTTVAQEVNKTLKDKGYNTIWLDGDKLRMF